LEHGGGSNSIAFLQLGNLISQNNWHLCAYDRLGYGRSSIIPRYLTVEQRAFVTNSVIKELFDGQPNQNIIIGGWSAGVEISQIYAKIYPQNVKGMIFMDGYPDYLILDAICNNKSEAYQSPALAAT
jgi:pimeloyl-ACP methyl ester carboxylesterase